MNKINCWNLQLYIQDRYDKCALSGYKCFSPWSLWKNSPFDKDKSLLTCRYVFDEKKNFHGKNAKNEGKPEGFERGVGAIDETAATT